MYYCSSLSLSSCFFGYYPLFPSSWSVRRSNTVRIIVFNWWSNRDSTTSTQTYRFASANKCEFELYVNIFLQAQNKKWFEIVHDLISCFRLKFVNSKNGSDLEREMNWVSGIISLFQFITSNQPIFCPIKGSGCLYFPLFYCTYLLQHIHSPLVFISGVNSSNSCTFLRSISLLLSYCFHCYRNSYCFPYNFLCIFFFHSLW